MDVRNLKLFYCSDGFSELMHVEFQLEIKLPLILIHTLSVECMVLYLKGRQDFHLR